MHCSENVVSGVDKHTSSKTVERYDSVYSGVKDTSPTKAMDCHDSVYSDVVKNTSLSETMECDDIVHNSCVHTKVKSVVSFVSETFKTGTSCSNDNVDTLKVVQNYLDTLETANSVKTNKFIDQKRHCKLHSCRNSCTFCVFFSRKEKSKPRSEKDKNKIYKTYFFVNHLSSVPPIENVHNVAQIYPWEVVAEIFEKKNLVLQDIRPRGTASPSGEGS